MLQLPAAGFDVSNGFFDLGGNSLLTIPLLRDLGAEFDRKVTLEELFAHPTIKAPSPPLPPYCCPYPCPYCTLTHFLPPSLAGDGAACRGPRGAPPGARRAAQPRRRGAPRPPSTQLTPLL